MARTLWRYYSDVGQRLRSHQSRYLTGGYALIGRLKLSLDKRRVPLWLNTRLIELLRENGRVIGARVERTGVESAIGARQRSEERRVGKDCDDTCRSRGVP